MLTITKIFEFAAAHYLPFHEGKCKNLHGHGFKLEITVTGTIKIDGSATGMIMDFSLLKAIVEDIILKQLDHSNLNDVFENPTAEFMVKYIANKLDFAFNNVVKIIKVRLWETSTSYVEWTNDENIIV